MTDERDAREAELARLADGTLPAERAELLRARVEGSPELAAALAEQERAVTMLRALDVPAPDRLHAAVAGIAEMHPGQRARRQARPAWPQRRWARAFALPLVAAVAVAVAIVAAGTPAPTVAQTARLALAAATQPAPAVDPADPARLMRTGAGIPFPNWRRTAGWTATGSRSDTVGGRRIETVFYTSASGTRVGYSIVSGSSLRAPGGSSFTRYGVRFTVARAGDARLITWARDGHTCVIAGRGVSAGALTALAAGEGRPAAGQAALLYPGPGGSALPE
ncbi:MAG: anti-sigma factor family protein [Solirubrobacteraceae bacterium]